MDVTHKGISGREDFPLSQRSFLLSLLFNLFTLAFPSSNIFVEKKNGQSRRKTTEVTLCKWWKVNSYISGNCANTPLHPSYLNSLPSLKSIALVVYDLARKCFYWPAYQKKMFKKALCEILKPSCFGFLRGFCQTSCHARLSNPCILVVETHK